MNVISLLTPKSEVTFLYEDCTVRQGLQKIRSHSYTAIPVLSRTGAYVGTISEGDFLNYLLNQQSSTQSVQRPSIRRVMRKTFNPAVSVRISMEDLLERALQQTFIPVVDDRGAFIGIVTRKTILMKLAVPALETLEKSEKAKSLERIMA